MQLTEIIIVITFITICACGFFLMASWLIMPFYHKIVHVNSFEEVYTVFVTVVKNEIDLYENDVFEHRQTITNANFENYYKDLCNRIISKLSPQLKRELRAYISEEAIYSYIARTVKQYLANYIKNPL